MTPLLDALRAALGAPNVLTEGDLSAWEVDWRKRYRGRALAVVRPSTAAEVAAVVAACATHRCSIVTQGGNTGLVGGAVPDASGKQVLLSMARMNRVREIDAANATMTVDAGCVLQTVQEAATAQNFLFPLSLAAEGSCTIGGNLATNAGGTQVLRYGTARELCLGIEIVTACGDIWDGLGGLRKDNTGYDLRDLFIGSEGTLGVITGAVLKLYPLPAAQMTALATTPSLEAAVTLLERSRNCLGAGLTAFEVMGDVALSLVRRHFPSLPHVVPSAPWAVLLEQSDAESAAHARSQVESLLEAAITEGLVLDAVVAHTMEQSRAMWRLRESIPLAQAQEGLNVKHDIALPVSRLASFVARTDARLMASFPGVGIVNFGHLGDGNLHYNVQAPVGVAAEHFLHKHEAAVNAMVYDAVTAHGGTISAEHGIGQLKRDELLQRKSPAALGMMRAIKSALDPSNLLNPGRVI